MGQKLIGWEAMDSTYEDEMEAMQALLDEAGLYENLAVK